MISKLVRRFFSANSFKKRSTPVLMNASSIKSYKQPEKITTFDKPGKQKNMLKEDTPIANSVMKFDDLKAIYQKQPKSNASTFLFESFEEIPELSSDFLSQMNKNGILKPTDIQKSMLGHFFSSPHSDLLIKSRPGSGKSIGYLVMLLAKHFSKGSSAFDRPRESSKITCKYLIIVPSELLAKQLVNWLQTLSENRVISSILCETFQNICDFSDFLVTTPEAYRMKMAQGLVDLKGLDVVVLDEADALIKPLKRFASAKQKEMRLKHPNNSILLLTEMLKAIATNKLFNRPRMIVSSATLNSLTREQLLSSGITKDPIFLEDKRPLITRIENLNPIESQVNHFHALMKKQEDTDELVKLIHKIVSSNPGKLGAIFIPAAQSKLGLCGLLQSSPEFSNVSIGLLCNRQPDEPTCSTDKLLIASDIDCRGIDIPELSYVVILDLPGSLESYIHMAGRVGRTGQTSGNVYTILGTSEDFNRFSSLLRYIQLTTIPFLE